MKRLSGFSLMEMMTVLLIVSIVAAATAPMINKKMMASRNIEAGAGAGAGAGGGGGCHWQDVGNGNLAYNQDGNGVSVIIGSSLNNWSKTNIHNANSRLHVVRSEKDRTQITLGDNSEYIEEDKRPAILRFVYSNASVGITSFMDPLGYGAVAIGENSSATGASSSIAIGNTSTAEGMHSIAMGYGSKGGSEAKSKNYAIAIGFGADTTKGNRSIAIGTGTETEDDALTIGCKTYAAYNAIAIGKNLDAYRENSICIGRDITAGKEAIIIGNGLGANKSPRTDEDPYPQTAEDGSIVIGNGSVQGGYKSITIGYDAKVIPTPYDNTFGYTPSDAIAIGTGAVAKKHNSVAIGHNAEATKENQIVLGTADSTVYIPGNLVVGKDVLLNTNKKSTTALRVFKGDGKCDVAADDDDRHLSILQSNDFYGEDDNFWLYSDVSGLTKVNSSSLNTLIKNYLSSDRRLKNVGKAFTGGLAELKKLDLFHFTYKKDKSNTPHVGVMAQDLQKVFPDAVTKGDDGFLRIRMEDMFYALVNAVKELAGMFDKQDERIVQLEKENKQLQKTISDLEKQNNEILKRLAKLEKQK